MQGDIIELTGEQFSRYPFNSKLMLVKDQPKKVVKRKIIKKIKKVD